MHTNGGTHVSIPSLNDILSGNRQTPNQVSYTKISEKPDSTTKVVRKVVTSQQPTSTTESTYYAKKVTTTTTTTRGNQGPSNTTSSTRYSNINTSSSNRNPSSSYSRPAIQTNKTTTTTTTSVPVGQYSQYSRTPNTNTNSSQVYRGGIPKSSQPSSQPSYKMENSQSYTGNKYQPKRPEQSTNYKPKAKSPEPGSIKRKTIYRGDPIKNVQITHIIFSSGPAEFHITENLNLDNLKTNPIQISKEDREKLQKSGTVTTKCSCDGVEIANKKPNLKGTTLHYQHAQGLGMTNDKKDNLNPLFYSSEIKKLDPISKEKEQEKIENVENFRSNGKDFKSSSPNKPTTTTTTTKTTTTYNKTSNYNPSQNYRGATTTTTNSNTNRRGVESSISGRGIGNSSTSGRIGVGTSSTNNRGGIGTSVKTTTSYTRGSNIGSGGDAEIIKDTRTKVQMGSRSFKNTSQPTTYTTTERKVYTQNNFFNK